MKASPWGHEISRLPLMLCSIFSSQASPAILSTSITSEEEGLQAQMPFSRVVTGDEVSCRSPVCCHDLQQPARLLSSN